MKERLSLTYLRNLAGYSQRELATIAGMSSSTINYLEHGRRQIRLSHARTIVIALNAAYRQLGYEQQVTISDVDWKVFRGNEANVRNLIQFKHQQANQDKK